MPGKAKSDGEREGADRKPELSFTFGQSAEPPLDVPVYTVHQLNREVRALLEEAYSLVWVDGEISNFTHHRSGHMYFTLKDDKAQVDAAMFQQANRRLSFKPEDGMGVLALAQATVYEPRGRYQIVVQEMRPAGAGKLQLAFEQLKARLQAEGLFDPARKRPLPPFPQRIGIVTAPGAAALRDMYAILNHRYPVVEVLLFPAQVQGQGAAQEIASAIARANRFSAQQAPIDVLIVGRGGGSLEDLWAFNEEVVARAVAASKIPVVSAVGHEVDFTICDFVADVRAPTPSAAAALVAPDRVELIALLQGSVRRAAGRCAERWKQAVKRLEWIRRSHGLRRPLQRLQDARQTLDQHKGRLLVHVLRKLKGDRQRHQALLMRLNGANPAAILRRGYAVVKGAGGQVIRRSDQLKVGDALSVRFQAGSAQARVEGVNDE